MKDLNAKEIKTEFGEAHGESSPLYVSKRA